MVVPQMAAMAARAAVLLFVLNENPRSPAGRRFDALLADLIPGAWRVTCPPLEGTGVKGESRYHAESSRKRCSVARMVEVLRQRRDGDPSRPVGVMAHARNPRAAPVDPPDASPGKG